MHDQDDSLAGYAFWSYLIFYIISLAIWILNCYADREPDQTKYPKSKYPYPEQGASFLSRLFYTWFDPLAWKGYRRPLEQKDLWDMNPEDSSKEIMPLFIRYWDRAVAKASGYNLYVLFFGRPSSLLWLHLLILELHTSFHSNRKNAFDGSAAYTKTRTSASVTITPEQKKKKRASILGPIAKAFGPTFLFGAILKLVQDLLTFVSPQLLRALIKFVSPSENATLSDGNDKDYYDAHPPMWRGILYAVLLFVVASMQTLFLSQYFQRMIFVGLRIRTALVGTIYKKALGLSNTARKSKTVGEIVNLMAVDAQRFMDLTT